MNNVHKQNSPINRLFFGDCLTIMVHEMEPASVDLIYLDPPFNSNEDYNAIYKDETGRPLPDQIEAYSDTWELNENRIRSLRDLPILMQEKGIDDEVIEYCQSFMQGLRNTNPSLLAYLAYMTERLLYMKSILKPTGSIYLHCDPTASHYLKIIMDIVFGQKNFLNEIIWGYEKPRSAKNVWRRNHDVIFFYKNGNKWTFNPQRVPTLDGKFEMRKPFKRPDGKIWQPKAPGKQAGSWWYDIASFATRMTAKERMGYDTQKPLKLLRRIIRASSNEGDVVFDPFCGCATTIEAAHTLNRHWIGVDVSIHAIKRVSSVRLLQRLGIAEGLDYLVNGVPRNLEGAHDLWQRDEYHFQKWAVEQVDGFVTKRKTRDGGIDGRIYFVKTDMDEELSSMVIEVKGGKQVGIETIRSLRGVLERDTAEMAGLILLEPPSSRKARNFNQEIAFAGEITLHNVHYPRMQILTVEEILNGKKFETPSKVKGRGERQPVLPPVER